MHELRRNQCRWRWRKQAAGQEAWSTQVPVPVTTPDVASSLPDAHGDEVDTEEPCTTPAEVAKTTMGFENFGLGSQGGRLRSDIRLATAQLLWEPWRDRQR